MSDTELRRLAAVAPDGAREALEAVLYWAGQRCPCENEQPDPCPLCGVSVASLEACKAIDAVLPKSIKDKIDKALALPAVVGIEGRDSFLQNLQGAVHLLRKAIHARDPINELDLRCHDIWTDLEKLCARHPHPPVEDKRAALEKCYDALSALKSAVETSGKMNGREYIDLGIQVNNALDKAHAALAHPLEPATEAGERGGVG